MSRPVDCFRSVRMGGSVSVAPYSVTGSPGGERSSPSGAWAQAISVLLVEDDDADAILVEELIFESAPEIGLIRVPSAAGAAARLGIEHPECILLDLHLPDADGIEALRRIQKCAPEVPVVVLTGLNDQNFGTSAVAAGAQDYLVKGRVDSDTLRRAVHYAIERKRAESIASELRASQLRAAENARLERGLLPSPLLRGGVDVVARYRPGAANSLLGGDFYDVVQTDDELVHVLIGDVSGHGPVEAALGVALRIAWRTLVMAGVPTAEHLHHLDRILRAERTGRFDFATVTVLTIDPERSRVAVARAGHPPMLVHGPRAVHWLDSPVGSAVGIPGAGPWQVHQLDLPVGSGLILLTDGLFEGHAGTGQRRIGEEGLLELAQPLAHLAGAEFVDALIGAAEALAAPHGGLGDDVAVLHIRIQS